MSAVLTIVGSSARAAAQSAARSGFCVHAADIFADADLLQVANSLQVDDYPEGLGRVIAGSQPGSWLYTGALENYPELISQWQQLRPLLGIPAEVLRCVRNPELVSRELKAAGLPAPTVRLDAATLPRDGSWLSKPCRSAGGARISRLNEAWRDSLPHPGEYYFQQHIDGISVAAVYLATKHDVSLLGVTRQLCGAAWGGDSDFRFSGSIGPLQLSASVTNQFRRIGAALHRSFGLVGLFGVDAILQDNAILQENTILPQDTALQGDAILKSDNPECVTVWPVEVNPRYTASVEVLERAMEFDAVAAHVVACADDTLTEPSRPLCHSGKLIVWAKRRCQFPSLTSLVDNLTQKLPAGLDAIESAPTLADIPATDAMIDAGAPIATVLADAASPEEVAQLLESRAAALQACCPAM